MDTEKLQEKLARKDKEFQILQRFAAEITSTLDLDQILKIIFESMDEALDFKHSMLLLYQEPDEILEVIASYGYEKADVGAKVPLGKGIIGTVAKHKRVMRMNSLGRRRIYARAVRLQLQQQGKRTVDHKDEIPLPGLKDVESQLAIPLIVQDRLVGILSVEDAEIYAFDKLDETLLSVLGSQVASAIDNARLYKLEEQRIEELNAAYEKLSELNQTLEDRVKQRTQELSQALYNLEATQTQLVESEKMAAMGNLVAGIVHEINNPIGVIRSSADVAQRCLNNIGTIETTDNPQYHKSFQILQSNTEVILEASSRIAKIADSLKSFIHLDEAELQQTDLNVELDNTLAVIQNEIGGDIEIVKEYGDVPKIVCYPAQLNQVFINLLLNSIRAIKGKGIVRIKTYVGNDLIYISILDTGIGIPSDKLEKIFDMNFTAKGNRVSMGMGLPTVYSIIQKHHGEIKVNSKVGEGSEFIISLPIDN